MENKDQVDQFIEDIQDLKLSKDLQAREFYGRLTITFRKGKVVVSNLEETRRHDH